MFYKNLKISIHAFLNKYHFSNISNYLNVLTTWTNDMFKMFLKRFKSDIDTSCSFCDDPNETDMHIFWDCPHTQTFWVEFSNIINRNVLQGFSLLFKDVLFGFFNIQKDKINEYFFINLLLLLAKFHIHRSKFTHQNPLLFLKKRFNSISKLFHPPRILKLSKQLIYFIFLNYSVKALFWIIYCYMHVETVLCR